MSTSTPRSLTSIIFRAGTSLNLPTKDIAEEFRAKVFDFVWTDDFAAARNAALSHATGDYAF